MILTLGLRHRRIASLQRAHEARLKEGTRNEESLCAQWIRNIWQKVVSSVSIVSFVLNIGKQGLKKVF